MWRLTLFLLLFAALAYPQSRAKDLAAILDRPLETTDVVTYQLRQYLYHSLTKPPSPTTPEAWTSEVDRIRKHTLDDVVFHGWPKAWVNSPPKFEDLGVIEGDGYLMHKLRYEIVPGFQSTAILYVPKQLSGKAPGVLNVNGHDLVEGKAVEYKQKRCINQARRGMIALNLEWLDCGELHTPENAHIFAGHLDLAGVNGVGLFYLAMRRGLDYLDTHPSVDRNRLAVTGLSGGGWQTIVLSALDPRVLVSIPVAGYSALINKLSHRDDYGDNEQTAADLLQGQDYTHLTAMRAPRPTLIIHNAEDDCCFRAPLEKPYNYDLVLPFFRLYGKEDAFGWHENMDPSWHNYQLDNRLHAYSFLSKHLGVPAIDREILVDGDVKSQAELTVGLPKSNLTILALARQFSNQIKHDPPASAATSNALLKAVTRYRPVSIEHTWALANTKSKGVESLSWQFLFDNQLSATAVWIKAIAAEHAPVTIVLHDEGKKAAAAAISERVNRGEQVVALDLVFHGDASLQPNDAENYVRNLSTSGQRALGVEAAQLIAVTRWISTRAGGSPVRLQVTGKRNQVTALAAAAIEPGLFSEIFVENGMRSLQYLFDSPVSFRDAPDLFCLDLYKDFDIDTLAKLAAPTKVTQKYR